MVCQAWTDAFVATCLSAVLVIVLESPTAYTARIGHGNRNHGPDGGLSGQHARQEAAGAFLLLDEANHIAPGLGSYPQKVKAGDDRTRQLQALC